MNAFYFGTSERPLFGAYDAAHSARTGVVICQAWAREYLLAHPTMRLLSRRLSEAGVPTLRFDYFGTGDSAGDETEVTLAQCAADVSAAIEELRETSGVTDVALVAMRLGAVPAFMAAAELSCVHRIVLWDPVWNGTAYLDELNAPPVSSQPDDVNGVQLTPGLRKEIESITLATFQPGATRTSVVNTASSGSRYAVLVAHFQQLGVPVEQVHVPDVQVWREEWGTGGVGMAVRAVSQVVTWLT